MTQELFERLKLLLPGWGVRRGNRGTHTKRRPMIFTTPGPTYHPDPEQEQEHSLRLIVLLPTKHLEQYEISLVPIYLFCRKFFVKEALEYVAYNTDYVSKIANEKLILPADTPVDEVAKQAAFFLTNGFEDLCAHFVRHCILQEPRRRMDEVVIERYMRRLFKRGFEKDTPPWLENLRDNGRDLYFDTNIWGSMRTRPQRVRITGVVSAQVKTDWTGKKNVKITCMTEAHEMGKSASPPCFYARRELHVRTLGVMPSYRAFKLAILEFMENRIKLRYNHRKKHFPIVVWDDTLPEGMTAPALGNEAIA